MTTRLFSTELHGVEGFLVEIEIDKRAGLPAFIIVGLPDTAVQEARERIRSAVKNSGFEFPRSRIIVNMAPADLRKAGPRYDLAMALGILAMTGNVPPKPLEDTIILGELALNGSLRPINGVLSSVEFAKNQGFSKVMLPRDNAKEAALIPGIKILPAANLKEALLYLNNKVSALPVKPPTMESVPVNTTDMSAIKGQAEAKRGLEIAAAGGHNILFCGAPGAGKTLMARALNGILPSMTLEEMLETSKIYSIAGLLPKSKPLISSRPFRTIHHTASGMSIVGGGNMPGPGEISLAHRGVMFMDEIAEFPKSVLEVLRQPMEDKTITVSRVKGSCTYPCQFTLVAAMNPCPCGYYNVETGKHSCTCTAAEIARYEKRISGPLLDRIDIFVNINPVDYSKLTNTMQAESSETIRNRVEKATIRQRERFTGMSIRCNAEMKNKEIENFCAIDKNSKKLLEMAMSRMNLSARGYFRILKLARTIADIEDTKNINAGHVAEALQYRKKI